MDEAPAASYSSTATVYSGATPQPAVTQTLRHRGHSTTTKRRATRDGSVDSLDRFAGIGSADAAGADEPSASSSAMAAPPPQRRGSSRRQAAALPEAEEKQAPLDAPLLSNEEPSMASTAGRTDSLASNRGRRRSQSPGAAGNAKNDDDADTPAAKVKEGAWTVATTIWLRVMLSPACAASLPAFACAIPALTLPPMNKGCSMVSCAARGVTFAAGSPK